MNSTSLSTIPKRKWKIQLSTGSSQYGGTSDALTPLGYVPGNFEHGQSRSGADQEKHKELIMKSAMGVATAPGKQLMMTCFMLWMSGNTLQIFSIMMLCMSFWNPLSAIFSVNSKFQRYADSGVNLLNPKIVFVLCNLVGLGIASYKASNMGLMPSSLDWNGVPPVKPALEWAMGSVSY